MAPKGSLSAGPRPKIRLGLILGEISQNLTEASSVSPFLTPLARVQPPVTHPTPYLSSPTMAFQELNPPTNFMRSIPQDHFLALPRPDIHIGPPAGAPDTSTLAAHDFDVDTRSGFMPPDPPVPRLPEEWEAWEATLDDAVQSRLQLGDKQGLTEHDKQQAARWQARVREVRLRFPPPLSVVIEGFP